MLGHGILVRSFLIDYQCMQTCPQAPNPTSQKHPQLDTADAATTVTQTIGTSYLEGWAQHLLRGLAVKKGMDHAKHYKLLGALRAGLAHRSIQLLTPLPSGSGSVML